MRASLDIYNNETALLEQETCKCNEEEVESFFSGPERLLSITESREMLFEELTSQAPEMGYLCIIYDTIGKYEGCCGQERYVEARKEARKLHRMISSFYDSETNVEEEKDCYLEDTVNVNNEISKVINEIFSKRTQMLLTRLVEQEEIKDDILDKDLFRLSKGTITKKISELYKNIEKNRAATENSSKFLSIPAIQFKKTLKGLPCSDQLEKLVDALHSTETPQVSKLEKSMTILVVKNGLARKTIAAKDHNRYTESEEDSSDFVVL
eukprot:TRINITY_DN5182_c0_g1_i7.p1 TRINITY_DN5182_c0_g1~~TRINITY_DN5182_c0_g1_i7.p1  ORF type:complete len:267 (-),score=54.45 TRINITY_DN5182_c0_g1_i7:1953-2753(-)